MCTGVGGGGRKAQDRARKPVHWRRKAREKVVGGRGEKGEIKLKYKDRSKKKSKEEPVRVMRKIGRERRGRQNRLYKAEEKKTGAKTIELRRGSNSEIQNDPEIPKQLKDDRKREKGWHSEWKKNGEGQRVEGTIRVSLGGFDQRTGANG